MGERATIDNPVINSPYSEPDRHFEFTDDGITNRIIDGRRPSAYFIPIPRPKKKGGQLAMQEMTGDRLRQNDMVNDIRRRVLVWRQSDYVGVTPTTRRLLQHWTDAERDKPLFYCQIEALETVIYITEVAKKYGEGWIESWLRDANTASNPGLPRIAHKMATGSGKTVVMAMLIAWQSLNKLANPQDARFSDAFLIVTPGITIRDRLRVLLPSDPGNYYRERDIVPAFEMEQLNRASIVITNFHSFKPRQKMEATKLTKQLLSDGKTDPLVETEGEVVRRVCRELGNKKNIVVINDEAHHCYRQRPDGDDMVLAADERGEAQQREEEARVWITGIEAVKKKLGVRAIYDLSATPFFLRGSGYAEGTLFPWVVSDFSLIDAIESGVVKIPRVPVADDSMVGESPTYRDLWYRIRDELPKKGRKTDSVGVEPHLPLELEGALRSLYQNYEQAYSRWEGSAARAAGKTPPVFIVVCNNTNVSNLVFNYIAGWEAPSSQGPIVQAGKLDLFRNDDGHGGWLKRPRTILVDSAQLESGEGMSSDFKKAAAREIEEFKTEYRLRFPGRDADALTDEDLLREVMNTVGKPGRLGEGVQCVVSVSMLTEGWDANTVTHILGVRAFGTQLLCEQVVGRALRRTSYAVNDQGMFDPEYAEVYGVPFSFIPANGGSKPVEVKPSHRVRALEERVACEITFPRLLGYRWEIPEARLLAKFTEDSVLTLSPADVPTLTEVSGIVGEKEIHTLADLEAVRVNAVAYELAKRTLERYFRDDSGKLRPWLFPQLLRIVKSWLAECVVTKEGAFPQLLVLLDHRETAVDRIYKAIVRADEDRSVLKPTLRPYDNVGSTRDVDFDTTRPVWPTRPDKCHVSHVAADTESWEQKMAQVIEELPATIRYVKNQSLGFTIPYALNGQDRQYVPDFIVHLDDGRGAEDPLQLIVEVTGEKKKDKAIKVETARTLWVPAVNNQKSYGRWDFVEVTDPWDGARVLEAVVSKNRGS